MRVSRTCTEIREGKDERRQEMAFRPLEEYRLVPAYVLLGDPGAGKSTAFEMECKALGESACKITARRFLNVKLKKHPEWRFKTLFIDGLDEVRAGSSDARTPFDRIWRRLYELDRPRFRLSCREADWLGANDREHLKSVSPDSAVTVLRLDPLTYENITSILNARPDIADARDFIFEARERDVAGFLENPQTLELLAEVVGADGEWPTSRKELFEKACARMVREHNKEHRAAKALSNPPEPGRLLDAAGRLCTVQLIAGAAGWTLHGEGDKAYPEPGKCQGYSLEILRFALGTKLFRAVSNDNRFTPIHRHIAEFLAGRHIAGVIAAGLPPRRVISMITGKDGVVVTEMRELSLWLAAHCQDVRTGLIEEDPVGVGLYGNIPEFSLEEKRALLTALNREASRPDSSVWGWPAAFRALATPELKSEFREILTSSSQEEEHQGVVCLALLILKEGECLPGFSELLLEIVCDDTRWPRVNYAALETFIHSNPASADKTNKLKTLLADVQSGNVSDPDKRLLAILLTRLYPRELPPSEVWDYLSGEGDDEEGEWVGEAEERYSLSGIGTSTSIGGDIGFWLTGLLEKSSDKQVAELLDNLKEQLSRLQPVLDARLLHDLPLQLLARGLEVHGDKLDTKRLYGWLDVGLAGRGGLRGNGQEGSSEIRLWMEQRPEVQKDIILEGLLRCPESDAFRFCASNVRNRLYRANRPADIGLWCLKQAVSMENARPHIAKQLLEWAFLAYNDPSINEGLSLDILKEHARKSETLSTYLDRLLAPPHISPQEQEWREKNKKYAEEKRQEEEKLLAYVRSNETALRENRAAPRLLYEIAQTYFSGFANSGGLEFAPGRFSIAEQASSAAGVQAVKQWLYGDQNLTGVALQGLRGVIDREDVPDVEEVLDLETKRRMHYLGLPLLAALEEIKRTVPEDDASQWSDDRIRKAVVFYYCYGNYLHMPSRHGYRPEWYRKLLAERPEIVAEVLVQYGRCVFQIGDDYVDPMADKFRKLELDPDHAQVAQHATLLLLRSFPIRRAPEDQSHLLALNHLFWAAIKHANQALLQELIERKRSLKSITAAQRVRWLATGAMVWPGEYTDFLQDFVREDQENRIRYLKAFFGSRVRQGASEGAKHTSSYAGRELFQFDTSKVPLWKLLIRLMGSAVGPDWWGDHASDLIRMLIKDLVVCPEEEASNALTNLLADPALERWNDVLKQAQDNQRTIRRDAGYRHPDIKQVCETLDGGTPANPADLAALLMDRLREISDQIRGNTDDWRQYWNVDSHGRPQKPRPEKPCRDALLSDLRQRLPQGVDAEREGSYANDKEADIRVSYEGFNVPVEIKRNLHPELWSAIHNQLIAKYASDHKADGYGIYLVFWFGKEDTKTPHKRGYPADAEEMKKWLEDSLSPEEARRISVCVIDVSIPEGKSAGK